MISGHSYRITLQSSIEDTTWVPAVFAAKYPASEVLSANTLPSGQIELITVSRADASDIKTGDSIDAQIPGFPGPAASAAVVSVDDLGIAKDTPESGLSFWPIAGAAAIVGFVVWASVRIKRKTEHK